MESTVPNSPDSFADKTNELAMSFDLTVDEARRRAAVLQAIGAQWDPAVVLANELAAYELLYSGLDGPHPADLRRPGRRGCPPAPAER